MKAIASLMGALTVMGMSFLSLHACITTPKTEPVDTEGSAPMFDELREAVKGSRFREPTPAALDAAEAFFTSILQHDAPQASQIAEWQAAALPLGYKVEGRQISGMNYLIIKETTADKSGKGFFVIRLARDSRMSLLVPHGDSDQMTDEIGLHLCFKHIFASCAFNTVRRSQLDWAHAEDSHLQRFVRASAVSGHVQVFHQIHGFEVEKRKSEAARSADMILSTGSKKGGPCLKPMLVAANDGMSPIHTKYYGADVFELGATTNAQMRLLRELGQGQFYHYEMSYDLRKRLATDATQQAALYDTMARLSQQLSTPSMQRLRTDECQP